MTAGGLAGYTRHILDVGSFFSRTLHSFTDIINLLELGTLGSKIHSDAIGEHSQGESNNILNKLKIKFLVRMRMFCKKFI